MRTNMTTLTQIWMMLLLSNIPPDDHNADLPPTEVSVGLCHRDIGIAPTRHPVNPEKSNRALGFPALVTGLCHSYRVPVPPTRGRAHKTPSGPREVQQGPGVSSSGYGPLSFLQGARPPNKDCARKTPPVDPKKSNRVLGFLALITGLCQFYGVPVAPSKFIRPPINRAFIKKYCTLRQA
ncbi:hypothetical protein HKD37_09G025419 [Glycine soja]